MCGDGQSLCGIRIGISNFETVGVWTLRGGEIILSKNVLMHPWKILGMFFIQWHVCCLSVGIGQLVKEKLMIFWCLDEKLAKFLFLCWAEESECVNHRPWIVWFMHDIHKSRIESNIAMDHSPINQNFELNKSRQKFHHSLKEHHKISNIPKFRCKML